MLVTEKGQITIPKNVREAAGVLPGSEVNVTYEGGKIIIQRSANSRTVDRRTQLRKAAAKVRASMAPEFQQLNADDIMSFLRG